MKRDFTLLTDKIKEVYANQYNFSVAMRISEKTLSLKLNDLTPWKDSEIQKAIELLSIPEEDIHLYFFKQRVQGDCT